MRLDYGERTEMKKKLTEDESEERGRSIPYEMSVYTKGYQRIPKR